MTTSLKSIFAAGVIAFAAFAGSAEQADAARIQFGTSETLTAYAKTGMTHEFKPVDLCYKSKTISLFAPVHTTDEMVLCDVSKKTYWPVPTGERLKKLQAAGLMPNPLPMYSRPALDYLAGHSLWFLLVVLGFALVSRCSRMNTRNTVGNTAGNTGHNNGRTAEQSGIAA